MTGLLAQFCGQGDPTMPLLPSRSKTPAPALLLNVLMLSGSLVAATALAKGPAVDRPLADRPLAETRLGSNLAGLIDARRAGDSKTFDMLAANGEAAFDGDLVEVQIHPEVGVPPEAIGDPLFAAFGGRSGIRGIDMLLGWLPLQRLPEFIAADRRIAFIQLPWRPLALVGPNQSQGATILRTPPLECVGADGAGETVAVIDKGFSKYNQSVEKGEIPHPLGKVANQWGTHGTMCAEVVADVAPGATILPVQTSSFVALQSFFKNLDKSGNPYNVSVVSHSVVWLGMSFGRHTGFACSLVDFAKTLGIGWVNASGNSGSGSFYTAPYLDADGDGNHEFGPDDELLRWKQGGAELQLWVDWDDYALRKQNIDIHLYRQESGGWVEVAKSTKKHGGMSPPSESLKIAKPKPGVYGLSIRGGKSTDKGTRFRVMHAGASNGSFSIYHKNGNVYDPGSCKGVLTVGALRHNVWQKGPLEAYSSYGPTVDGRQKPELVAPTSVKTSVGWFSGTSASCPHAAGALAIYAAATATAANLLIDEVIADAVPMGPATPNDAYGWGRLRIPGEAGGWQCDADNADPLDCAAGCGTIGTTTCNKDCTMAACTSPAEACNGDDDDCDGNTDEGFDCAAGSESACTTTCLSAGKRVCTPNCQPGLCQPPAESCNGADDDCDGDSDEDFACRAGDTGTCTTTCGSEGTHACGEDCTWSTCAPPGEICNGLDDDCDGETDEGFEPCVKSTPPSDPPADDGCAASPASGGGNGGLWLICLAGLLVAGRRRYRTNT